MWLQFIRFFHTFIHLQCSLVCEIVCLGRLTFFPFFSIFFVFFSCVLRKSHIVSSPIPHITLNMCTIIRWNTERENLLLAEGSSSVQMWAQTLVLVMVFKSYVDASIRREPKQFTERRQFLHWNEVTGGRRRKKPTKKKKSERAKLYEIVIARFALRKGTHSPHADYECEHSIFITGHFFFSSLMHGEKWASAINEH